MLLLVKKTPPLLAILLGAALIDILCTPPIAASFRIGPLGQIALSALFVLALIIWLIVSGRGQAQEEKQEQE